MAEDWRGFSVPGWAVKRVDLWRFLDCCPMSMPEFGEALNREVEATEGRKVLLGYSMGGRLGLHALRAGGQWDAAVVVSAHPGLEDEGERVARREKDAEWAAKALSGDWQEFLEEWNGQAVLDAGVLDRAPSFARGHGGLAGHAAGGDRVLLGDRRALEPRRQAVARSFMDWTLGGQEALWERLAGIECPLLWCAGARDGKFRRIGERVEEGMERGKNAPSPFELWVAEDAGHRVPWEVPAAFAKKVGEFLERVVS
jgi:2-succinyl-6-hydroxy-2,4-cyclohexadiene-1-carboxylate synthase